MSVNGVAGWPERLWRLFNGAMTSGDNGKLRTEVFFGDSQARDAFGRLRVGSPYEVSDHKTLTSRFKSIWQERLEEAQSRSHDLGFGGETHVHENADGMKVFMPGRSHEEYIGEREEEYNERDEYSENRGGVLYNAIYAIINAIVGDRGKNALEYGRIYKESELLKKHSFSIHAEIKKSDEERRIVYGWASVVSEDGELLEDRQGHTITQEEMEKAADRFMLSSRAAKAMHNGGVVGEFIHSLPLTDDIAKAFGIESKKRGWIVGVKIYDDDVWKRVKSGELSALSIGGRSIHKEVFE